MMNRRMMGDRIEWRVGGVVCLGFGLFGWVVVDRWMEKQRCALVGREGGGWMGG